MANKLLGQHFLKNRAVVGKIIAALEPEKFAIVFEVGPGHGELTLPIFNHLSGVPAKTKIVAIEKDAQLAEQLSGKLPDTIQVVTGDALAFFTSKKFGAMVQGKPYAITGNIPYYLTGRLLRRISESDQRPTRCVLMVQKEVAERIVAGPPHMNRLAAGVQYWTEPKIISRVPRGDFDPQPAVDSAVVSFAVQEKEELDHANEARYYTALRAVFAQPRKTILNNIAAAFPSQSKEELALKIRGVPLDPSSRPQNLSIADMQAIAENVFGDK